MDAEKLPFQLESLLFGLSLTRVRRGGILIESMDAEKLPFQLKCRLFSRGHTRLSRVWNPDGLESMDAERVPFQLKSGLFWLKSQFFGPKCRFGLKSRFSVERYLFSIHTREET
jgi:hypothetical protein